MPEVVTRRYSCGLSPLVTAELLDETAAAGVSGDVVDLIRSLAYPLPVRIICSLLGVPEADEATFTGWSRALAQSLDPTVLRSAEVDALYPLPGGGRDTRIRPPRTVTTAPFNSSASGSESTRSISAIRALAGTSGSRTSPACGTLSRKTNSPKSVSIVTRTRSSVEAQCRSIRSPGSGPLSRASATS
jgi:hypothetical protein